MCGRYNFTVEESDEIRDILEKLNAKLHGKAVKTGEIYPTDQAPILIGDGENIPPMLGSWGFPKFKQKGVIINARSETVFEKKTFQDSLLNQRCIIPSTGFYEWDNEKRKILFRMEGTNALYMAGLYMLYQDELRYVILTAGANESMKDIHIRMPLVVPKQDIKTWIMDLQAAGHILKRVPPQLVKQSV